MTEYCYNDWPAYTDITSRTRPFVVNGTPYPGGIIDNDDVATVFTYLATKWAAEIEPLRSPGCWGASYRPNKNNPDVLSCHSGGVAIDTNAPAHPNGVEASADLILKINRILDSIPELSTLVHSGANWHYRDGLTPDPMHLELHNHDLDMLARVADRIRNLEDFVMDDKTAKQVETIVRDVVRTEIANALDNPVNEKDPGSEKFKGLSVRGLLKKIALATGAVK